MANEFDVLDALEVLVQIQEWLTLKVLKENPRTAISQGMQCYGEHLFANVGGRKQIAGVLLLALSGSYGCLQSFYVPLVNAVRG